jgi:hypothetical protein
MHHEPEDPGNLSVRKFRHAALPPAAFLNVEPYRRYVKML